MQHDSSPGVPPGSSGGSSSDRREALQSTDAFLLGAWKVEPRQRLISRRGVTRPLAPRLMELLVSLALKRGEVCPRAQLLDLVWKNTDADEKVLERAIADLREALEDDPRHPDYIETVGRKGYRLIASIRPLTPGASAGVGAALEHDRPRRPGARLWRDTDLWRTFGVIVVLIALGLVFVWEARRRHEVPTPQVTRRMSYPGDEQDPALSPGGKDIAFAWTGPEGDDYDIYVQRPDRDEPIRLTTEPGPDRDPVWSPDGQELIYEHVEAEGATLYRTTIAGDRRVAVLTTRRPLRGFDWSPDGKHLVYADEGLHLLDLQTGRSRDLPVGTGVAALASDPVCSPDGRQVAFLQRGPGDAAEVQVVDIEGGPSRRIAGPLEDARGLTWSRDGSSLRVPASMGGERALWRLPLEGGAPTASGVQDPWMDEPSAPRDSDRMIYRHAQSRWEIWRIDLAPAESTAEEGRALIASGHEDREPRISPDGSRIAFTSNRTGSRELWWCARDGLDPARLTTFGSRSVRRPRWSPDGHALAFTVADDTTSLLYWMATDGGLPQHVAVGHRNAYASSWSRDRRAIYFGSDRSGQWELWRVDVGGHETTQVTEAGAISGFETPDGAYLYYARIGQGGLWRLRLPLEARPREGELVDAEFPAAGDWDVWAVSPSGIVLPRRAGRETDIHVLAGATPRLLAKLAVWPAAGFSLSQKEDLLLYDRRLQQDGDLVILENVE